MERSSWQKSLNWIAKILVLIAGIILGQLLVSIWLGDIHYVLEGWSYVATIVGGASIVIAAGQFYYQREQDRDRKVVDLLGFFREKIIRQSFKVEKKVKELVPSYDSNIFPKIEKFEIIDFKNNHPSFYNRENQLMQARTSIDDQMDVIELLNMLEEFAQYVLLSGAAGHRALNSVRSVFVSLSAKNFLQIMSLADINVNGSFPGIRDLYMLWK